MDDGTGDKVKKVLSQQYPLGRSISIATHTALSHSERKISNVRRHRYGMMAAIDCVVEAVDRSLTYACGGSCGGRYMTVLSSFIVRDRYGMGREGQSSRVWIKGT